MEPCERNFADRNFCSPTPTERFRISATVVLRVVLPWSVLAAEDGSATSLQDERNESNGCYCYMYEGISVNGEGHSSFRAVGCLPVSLLAHV